MWMLLIAAGLLFAVLGRTKDRTVPEARPVAPSTEEQAVVLRFPKARQGRPRRRARANRG